MSYQRTPRENVPTISFRDVEDATRQYYAVNRRWPDEVLVGSEVRFTGIKPNWNFIKGRVLFFSGVSTVPFALVVDTSLKPDEIVCRSEPGEQHV
jgi:hypothetical protein